METVAETNRGKYRTYNFKVQACSGASLRSPSKGPINIQLLHPQSIVRIILDFVPSMHHLYIQQRHASLARTLKPPKVTSHRYIQRHCIISYLSTLLARSALSPKGQPVAYWEKVKSGKARLRLGIAAARDHRVIERNGWGRGSQRSVEEDGG